MYLIVFIHELGHITMSLIFNFKIKKINIYPFGGYTIFDNNINNSFISEFLVFIGGILFQIILYFIFNSLDISTYTKNIFNDYNFTILLFNLLPIIPLDGSKLLNIILNKFISFKRSHLTTIYLSYLTIIIYLLINTNININMILMSILLIIILINEHKNHLFIFNRFLVERYIKSINYKNINFIKNKNINNIKKYCNNVFINNNKYYSEKEMLSDKFNKNN